MMMMIIIIITAATTISSGSDSGSSILSGNNVPELRCSLCKGKPLTFFFFFIKGGHKEVHIQKKKSF